MACDYGSPRDQVRNFVPCGYTPYPWQWRFHAAAREADKPSGPVQVACGGARGPGKSHAIFAQVTLDDCIRTPNLKALFLRQTGKAAKESFEDLISRVIANKTSYTWGNGVLRFPNGSRVILGGFKDEKDIDKYVGIEYDVIGIEEQNQLSESKVEMLRGSLRTSKDNWRPRMYSSFNPGGVGHGYVKTTFVEPYRSGLEKDTRFIPATYRDNPGLNTEYIQYLEGLQGQLGQAWRDGDFDILAGTFFTEWRSDVHVIEQFIVPDGWRKFACLDYGYEAPSALYWLAVDPDGRVIAYRELYRTQLTFSQLAEEFSSRTPTNEKVEYLVCDPSIWNRDGRSDQGLSGAEIFETRYAELNASRYERRSIRLERGNNDRLAGWAAVREAMRPYKSREEVTAKFLVMDNCTELIRTIPLQVHDERNPEDLDSDLEDHAVDSIRYGLMSRPTPAISREDIGRKEFLEMIRKKKGGQRAGQMLYYKRP